MTQGFTVPQRDHLKWIATDLDGTLAEPIWTPENPTSAIGDPIKVNVAKLREAVRAGYKVVIHTSRPWSDYEAIEAYLEYHDIPFRAIQCGKLLAALYIDDRGRHADESSWLP
jgi:hydroxymethylpyrimidine pyrophosphatase-like HAD family hydrolase